MHCRRMSVKGGILMRGPEAPALVIAVTGMLRAPCMPAGRPVLTVDGRALTAWTFDANNVLAWNNEAGYAAWLQFMALPGGPVFMGSLRPVDDAEGVPQGGARPWDVFKGRVGCRSCAAEEGRC